MSANFAPDAVVSLTAGINIEHVSSPGTALNMSDAICGKYFPGWEVDRNGNTTVHHVRTVSVLDAHSGLEEHIDSSYYVEVRLKRVLAPDVMEPPKRQMDENGKPVLPEPGTKHEPIEVHDGDPVPADHLP